MARGESGDTRDVTAERGAMASEFGVARSKVRHGLVVGGLLAAVGLAILLFGGQAVPDSGLTGALCLALALGAGLYAWRAGRAQDAQLRIDARGIWLRDWGVTLPWPRSRRPIRPAAGCSPS